MGKQCNTQKGNSDYLLLLEKYTLVSRLLIEICMLLDQNLDQTSAAQGYTHFSLKSMSH